MQRENDENIVIRSLYTYIERGQKLLSAVNEKRADEYNNQREMLLFIAGNICAETDRLNFPEFERDKYENAILFIESVRDVTFLLPSDLNGLVDINEQHNTFCSFNEYISSLAEGLEQSSSHKNFFSFLENDEQTRTWIRDFFDNTDS